MRAMAGGAIVSGRRTLVLAGFFGRGNAGDEAMLHCIVEAFEDAFDIIISVDERGAHDGFWHWAPYSRARIVHHANVDMFLRDGGCAGMLVGGGSLPMGFAGMQALCARASGVPLAMTGVDLWPAEPAPDSRWNATIARWLGLFDHVSVRTQTGLAQAAAYGVPARLAADWALRLREDDDADVPEDRRRAMIVIRELDPRDLVAGYRAAVEAMLTQIEAAGYVPEFLPFAPEDARFLDAIGLRGRAPLRSDWTRLGAFRRRFAASRWGGRTTPRRDLSRPGALKRWIGASGLMVSLGRLHPMIFAADTPCAAATILPPGFDPVSGFQKLRSLGVALGSDYFLSIDDFAAALRAGRLAPARADLVAAAGERLAREIEALRALFGAPGSALASRKPSV